MMVSKFTPVSIAKVFSNEHKEETKSLIKALPSIDYITVTMNLTRVMFPCFSRVR